MPVAAQAQSHNRDTRGRAFSLHTTAGGAGQALCLTIPSPFQSSAGPLPIHDRYFPEIIHAHLCV